MASKHQQRGGHKREDSQSSYYFVSHDVGTSTATRDRGDETAVIEELPAGATAENFAPKVLDTTDQSVRSMLSMPTTVASSKQQSKKESSSSSMFGYLGRVLFGDSTSTPTSYDHAAMIAMEDFSGAKKVDPKVFFAAERTYLAWMHSSVLLAGVSIAISAYSETGSASDIYGVMILPIAIVFMVYAMIQYGDRSLKIRKRSPGPYEDRWGPVILGSVFVIAIIAEFLFKLFESS